MQIMSDTEDELRRVILEISTRIESAQARYGDFTSAHEALGVVFEEFDELTEAIRANALESVREEAMDLAAVLIRLASQCRTSESLKRRSVK